MEKSYKERILKAEYDPTGGYDCITAAWLIKCGDKLVATVDLSDFGHNGRTEDPYNDGAMEARNYAMLLVSGFNALIDKEYI